MSKRSPSSEGRAPGSDWACPSEPAQSHAAQSSSEPRAARLARTAPRSSTGRERIIEGPLRCFGDRVERAHEVTGRSAPNVAAPQAQAALGCFAQSLRKLSVALGPVHERFVSG
jgi:hypothetical protein